MLAQLRLLAFVFVAFLVLPARLHAADNPDGAQILELAIAAAGGEDWANVRSLQLEGHVAFWGPSGAEPQSRADSYVMYREFDPNRSAAHGAEGRIRIIASNAGRLLWTVGYDGTTTWTEKGIIPPEKAEEFWASNMGFGIIRHARKPGFKAERVSDSMVDGHTIHVVRLTDPDGGVTLFGIDRRSHAIRQMAFMTPRGWHERRYSDFLRLRNPNWLQARTVTLYYNGARANTLYWQKVRINPAIDLAIFAYPGKGN